MHGGDIYRNRIELDFSVNVNPFGVLKPVRMAMEQSLQRTEQYPDLYCEQLREKLSVHYGLEKEQILCGNGASELIMAICRWISPKTALLTGPGFSGYKRALEAAACKPQIHYLKADEGFMPGRDLIEQIEKTGPELLFLTNPANPTGVLMDRTYLEELLQVCHRKGTLVVLDECFMELTGQAQDHSICHREWLCRYQELLVLRAFTKSFAIPGIRLGYLVCGSADIASKIQRQLPEWNVSIPAQAAGAAAMDCSDYLKESVAFIRKERSRLEMELRNLGAEVFPSQANYLLFRWKEGDLYEALLQKGILIRDCSDYDGLGLGYYRIAVKKQEENNRLLQAIGEIIGKL